MHDVTVFEAADRPGGHTNTVRVDLGDETHEVDTGFIVFNEPNYPRFTRLLDELQIETATTEMSFSVTDERSGVMWSGRFPGGVFAQRSNTFRPAFWRMLVDVTRFNRRARQILESRPHPDVSLEDLLADGRWSPEFVNWYLVPLGRGDLVRQSGDVHALPRRLVRPVLRQPRAPPPARFAAVAHHPRRCPTVCGCDRSTAGHAPAHRNADREDRAPPTTRSSSTSAGTGPERFDHVVVATHSDQALALLSDPSPSERAILGAFRYQPNTAVLHTDERMLPPLRRAWASWNYHRPTEDGEVAAVTYHMNRLQNIRSRHEICVTLNRVDEIAPEAVLATIPYSHPVFDRAAIAAQQRHSEISGQGRTSYCGAYWGYGFHEDGVASAQRVCAELGVRCVKSAIFEGTVFHRRMLPVRHEFTQRVALPLLDLDEIDEVCSHHPLWSSHRANAVQFRRSDFYGPPQQPLAEAIRDLVEERTGARPEGSVRMLAHLRTWGWLFNPDRLLLVLGCRRPRRPSVRSRRHEHAVARTTRLRPRGSWRGAMVRQGAPRVALPLDGPALPNHCVGPRRARHGPDREPH